MRLARAEYSVEQGKPIIYLFCREGNKRTLTKVSDFVPYFYCLEAEKNNVKGIRTDPSTYYSLHGEPVRKVYVTLPSDVPELREKYSHTFEADILYPIRWMIDEVDSLEPITPKILFLDIETDNSGRVPDVILAQEEVICVTCHCNNIYTTFVFRHDLSPGISHQSFDGSLHEIRYFKREEKLLEGLLKYIKEEDSDIICGWNSNRFDLPYLINRMKRLNIDYNELSPMKSVYLRETHELVKGQGVIIKGLAVIDLYDLYRRMTIQQHGQEESYKLDFIGQKVVGIGKTESGANIKWLWNNNLERLVRYNANDCQIMVKIDEKMRLLDFLEELRRLCFCNLEDCLTASRMTDSYILRHCHNKKIFPTKTHHEETSFEGAFVGKWAQGIYDNVIAFDLKSLYPSLIHLFNLSPETILNENDSNDSVCINNAHIKKDEKGFLPDVIESLFEEREKYKTLMKNEHINSGNWNIYNTRQYALKTLLNALYGQTAYSNSRFYSPKIAEITAYLGRKIIIWSKDFLESIGYKVLYCDTDSLFWEYGDDKIDFAQIEFVRNLLNDSYKDFIKQFNLTI